VFFQLKNVHFEIYDSQVPDEQQDAHEDVSLSELFFALPFPFL
jgi:hypothetical protein